MRDLGNMESIYSSILSKCAANPLKRFVGITTEVYFELPLLKSKAPQTVNVKKGAIMGVGGQTCGQFGENYKQSTETVDLIYQSWARGYMSGLNIMFESAGSKLRNSSDMKSIYSSIQYMCSTNPLKTFLDIATEIYYKLPLLMPKPSKKY